MLLPGPFTSVTRQHANGSTLSVLRSYEEWMLGFDLAPTTIRQRSYFAERWLTEWGTLDVPPARIAAWLRQFDGWTKLTYLNNLRSLYAWACETQLVAVNPTSRLRRPPAPPPKPNPLPPEQLAQLLNAAEGRLLSWLLLGYLAGLRCFEIAKFSGSDITRDAIYVCGKGGQEWLLPTHPVLWALAQHYPRDGYWFPSPHRGRAYISKGLVEIRIREHFRAHGVDAGAVHRLRHSYGTELDRAGVRPRVLQELMRHRSLNTTMRYTLVEHQEKLAGVELLPLPALLRRVA